MTIQLTKQDAQAKITIVGRLDTVTAPSLEKAINEELSGVTDLVLDMTGLEYISSAGLRVLLSAQKKMSAIGSLKLVGVGETVMEVLDMTGFSDVLDIEAL